MLVMINIKIPLSNKSNSWQPFLLKFFSPPHFEFYSLETLNVLEFLKYLMRIFYLLKFFIRWNLQEETYYLNHMKLFTMLS